MLKFNQGFARFVSRRHNWSSLKLTGPTRKLFLLFRGRSWGHLEDVDECSVRSWCTSLLAFYTLSHKTCLIVTNCQRVFDRPPCLGWGLKEVLRVTTFCKVVPSTLWALTYNQVTNFCNLLSFFSSKTLNHFRVKSKRWLRSVLSIYLDF